MIKLTKVVSLSIAAVVALDAPGARAQSAVEKMTELNRRALVELAGKQAEVARDLLLEAVVVGKEARLGEDKMMARTYLHLGAVYVEGLNDRVKGIRYLGLAIKVRPDIRLTPALVTPTLTAAFEEAKRGGGPPAVAPAPVAAARAASGVPAPVVAAPAAPKPAAPQPASRRGGPDEPDLPASIPQPLHCPNPDEAPPKRAIALRCVAQPGLSVTRVILFYRVPGGERFTAAPAVRSPKGWYNALVPASATQGKSLHYYFEARDGSDAVLGESGRGASPNLILIKEGAQAVGTGALAVLRFGKQDGGAMVEENPLEQIEREREQAQVEQTIHRRVARKLFVGLGLGTGYGWQSGRKQLEFRQDIKVEPGLAISGLMHLNPEIGYQLSERFAVSLLARYQIIPERGSGDPHPGHPAGAALAVLAKIAAFRSFDNTQVWASAAAGGGDGFRLVIPASPSSDPMTDLRRNDTVRGGPLVFGPGLGVLHHLGRHLALNLEARTLVGVPDIAFLVDFIGGMQVSF